MRATFALVLATVFGFLFVGQVAAQGAAIVVNTNVDEANTGADCSLREAITAANSDTAYGGCNAGSGADTITFGVSGTITVTAALPNVSTEMTIDGGAQIVLTSPGRAIGVISSGTLNLQNLTIADSGGDTCFIGTRCGAVINDQGTLNVTNAVFDGNDSGLTVGGNAGAIASNGILTVDGSTFTDNHGFYAGGAIFNDGSAIVSNSTFVGNWSRDNGGAIYNYTLGTMTVENSTFVENYTRPVAGVLQNAGSLTIKNTLIASSVGPLGATNNCFNQGNSSFDADVSNLDDDDSCGSAVMDTNLSASLGVLADNGGPTETIALLPGSPAIDAGDLLSCTSVDQRGVTRPQGTSCDVGAFEVVVVNEPPTAASGGPYLVAVDGVVLFDGSGSSDPEGGTLTETWAADGGTVAGASYTADATPGVYDVCLTVNDGTSDSVPNCTLVVVYDPAGGFVTGGGWIDSPEGAYTADPSLSGKASFGFVAKYKKGANVPDGNTQFKFKAGDLSFHSTSYDWLVVAGNKAQFRGEGTVNGEAGYTFMIWADDDNPDTFRIKIWGDNGTVYDNGAQQALGGGSIKVHKR